jgi:sterol desaturase/sphingolipid hydroxylase (fatty acid hydroxylase superfamily)
LALLNSVVHTTTYLLVNGFFLLADRGGWLPTYNLPRTKRMHPSSRLLRQTWITAAVNQLVIQPVGTFALLCWWSPAPNRLAPLGPYYQVFGHFVAALMFNEFVFYFIHRALHHPLLYKHIHKKHHQYVGTVGFAAEHAHPVEDLLSNDLPVIGYCLFMRLHPLIWAVYLLWRLEETYETHSGYCFEQSLGGRLGLMSGLQAEFHDFHHSNNTGNFGHYLIDELFGTMDSWLQVTQQHVIPPSSQKSKYERGPGSQNPRAPSYLHDPTRAAQYHLGFTCSNWGPPTTTR